LYIFHLLDNNKLLLLQIYYILFYLFIINILLLQMDLWYR